MMIIGAVIMLFICLAVVFIMLYTAKGKRQFPPKINKCPDFYRLDDTREPASCVPMFSTDPEFNDHCATGNSAFCPLGEDVTKIDICNKKNALYDKNVTMDGVTNTIIDCVSYV